MAKSAASYSLTRFNRLGFAEHVAGLMPCLGPTRCRHLYCQGVCAAPSDGGPCAWEAEYSRRLEAEFRERHEALTIIPDVDEFEELVSEHVTVYLQRSRAMTRLNRAWCRRTGDGRLSPDAFREFELAELYIDRLAAREARLQSKLHDGLERMRERAERLHPHLQAMELFVAGKKAAADAFGHASAAIWDEFVDGVGDG